MRNRTTKLHLATTFEKWQELDSQIDHAIANLINGDSHNAERLLLLLDLMTGERFEPQDRELVTFQIQRRAFTHTSEFEEALEAYMDRISPCRQPERKTA